MRNVLDTTIQNGILMRSNLAIGDTGIQSACYFSFWGGLPSLCGGDGDMFVSIQADREALNDRLPNTVKCSRVTQASYFHVTEKMQELEQHPGNWRPTRNCSTLA